MIKILCNRYSSVINHFAIKGAIIFSLSLEIFLTSYFSTIRIDLSDTMNFRKLDINFIIRKTFRQN